MNYQNFRRRQQQDGRQPSVQPEFSRKLVWDPHFFLEEKPINKSDGVNSIKNEGEENNELTSNFLF